jgi:hypothetical protein
MQSPDTIRPQMQRLLRMISALGVVMMALLTLAACCARSTSALTDGEYIRRAIYYNAGRMGLQAEHEEIERFLAQHPACCSVDRNSHMTSWNHVVVEVNYERPATDPHRNSEPFYKQYVEITACGERGDMYGEGTKTLEQVRH